MPSKLALKAVAACLLTAASAAGFSGHVPASGLLGSQLRDGLEPSCITEQTCGSLENRERLGSVHCKTLAEPGRASLDHERSL